MKNIKEIEELLKSPKITLSYFGSEIPGQYEDRVLIFIRDLLKEEIHDERGQQDRLIGIKNALEFLTEDGEDDPL